MKLKNTAVIPLLNVVLVFTLISCVEDGILDINKTDTETFNLPVDIAIPIAKGGITIREVVDELDIEDFELKTEDDGLIYFDYTSVFNIAEFIKVDVPDQTHQELLINDGTIVPDIIPVFPSANFTLAQETRFEVDVEGAEIYEAVVDGGNFEIFGNDVLGEINGIEQTLVVTIPEFSKDEVTFSHTFSNEDFGKRHKFDLSDYVMVTSRDSEGDYITIQYTYTIKNTTLTTVMVPAPEALYFEFSMTDIEPRYVVGFFGTREIYSGNSVVNIPIIDSRYVQDSTIFFKEPRLNISLHNPIAMPFNINIQGIGLINVELKDTIELETDQSVFSVDGGVASFPEPTQVSIAPANFNYEFNNQNSNLDELIGKVYDKVRLNYNVISNPEGKDPANNNVANFDSIDVEVESHAIFPLHVRVSNFVYDDTVAFDFETEVLSSFEEDVDTTLLDNLDSIKVVFGINNLIPLELYGQIYLSDDDYQIIDSVFNSSNDVLLAPAIVDEDGEVTEAGISVIELMVGPEKRNLWRPGKHIIFAAKASSADQENDQFVKVYDTSGLEFYVGFIASGNVSNEVLKTLEDQ